jgi:hypothetical protein
VTDPRDWVSAEFAQTQAARDARAARTPAGNPRTPSHISAVARMVAFGEVLERLDDVAPRRMQSEPGA